MGAEHLGEQPDVLPEHGLASNHHVGDRTPLDSTVRATTICGHEPTAEEIPSYSPEDQNGLPLLGRSRPTVGQRHVRGIDVAELYA